jgi:sugar O-acyltransferase (sialic acid O-acetyltransferase NeuD family)
MKQLILLGTSGNANDVLEIVEAINAIKPTRKVVGFLDDARPIGSIYMGLEILGRLCDAVRFEACQFMNCIGSEQTHRRRLEILASVGVSNLRFSTVVHPMASVSPRAKIGMGVYVSFGCSIGGGACLEDHVSLGPHVIVGHDTRIHRGAMLAPGAIVSGFANIGAASYLGAGSVVKQRITVGEKALVGMGAVVTRDVATGVTVIGNPARPIRERSDVAIV